MPPLRWLPYLLIVLAAGWLRLHDLTRRPLHADEANQAIKLGELLEAGHYAFDPRDHHGPTLYYAAVPVAWVRGERTTAALTETTLRLVPAFFGTAAVALLAWLATGGGLLRRPDEPPAAVDLPALAATALFAVSPPAVYYSRDFIQETLLATFFLGVVACARAWWLRRHLGWAIGAGVCAGLMQATKASAPLFLAAAGLAVLVARGGAPAAAEAPRRVGRALGMAVLAALGTAAVLYSSFFTHLAGLRDALAAYSHAFTRFGSGAAPTGHEKAWWYYLRLLGWYREGFVWHQVGLTALAVAGVAVALASGWRRLRAVAVYTLVVLAAFSIFAYKTPWHAVHFVPGMALLAGGALAPVGRVRFGWLLAGAAALAAVGTQYAQAVRVAFERPYDYRNPYAYVQSSPDVLKVRGLVEAARAHRPDLPVHIVSEEYWPLPWYLRGLPRIGYWAEPPPDCEGTLIIASAANVEAVRARLRGKYTETLFGLRPGFVCVVFIPAS